MSVGQKVRGRVQDDALIAHGIPPYSSRKVTCDKHTSPPLTCYYEKGVVYININTSHGGALATLQLSTRDRCRGYYDKECNETHL
jgi:hypothetical protein